MVIRFLPNKLGQFIIVVALGFCWSVSPATSPAKTQVVVPETIAAHTVGMQAMPGLLPLYWDAKKGRLLLEIPRLNTELLYIDSLPYGTGSNDLGLDRGQLADARLVKFERIGPRVMLVQPNQMFRSSAVAAAEVMAVRQSFPESVLGGFDIVAENPAGIAEQGAVLVDATQFFLRDVHGVLEAIGKKEAYKLDPARSAIALDATKGFPRNSEVEATLTFESDAPTRGSFVGDVSPDPHAMSVREHHSFLELPGPGFVPRRFDTRAGYFEFQFRDYNAALGKPLDQMFIPRHRLIKKDPSCVNACVAEQPLRYYVDRGAPEPIRSALIEGASWWDQAFQAAGWAPGTFSVQALPDSADPMDIRYNIIQWVHRYTRGWSYGNPVLDPRTGEIIKGNVTLGSLRSRQDYLIAEALLSPYVTGKNLSASDDPMLQMALARTRQLAAHETGHTLGLAHNFAASSVPHGAQESVSVMDYPHPWITLDGNGVPDLSRAYAVNIGVWDKVAINYGYREFPSGVDEQLALDRILRDATHSGLQFISDDDARPPGGAHPHAHLWDNGTDAADELSRIMTVRAAALSRFSANAIPIGAPMAQLRDTLAPLYLMHRYQTEAAVKVIGGLDYRYQLRGDEQMNAAIVGRAEQEKALRAVLKTLSTEALLLPERLLTLLPPRPMGLDRTRESLASRTGLTFDPIAAAEAAADLTLSLLFDNERAARLVEYSARGSGLAFSEVIDAALAVNALGKSVGVAETSLTAEVRSAVYARTVEALLTLAASAKDSNAVRAITYAKLQFLRNHADQNSPRSAYLSHRIQQFFSDPSKFAVSLPTPAPPGSPIGSPIGSTKDLSLNDLDNF